MPDLVGRDVDAVRLPGVALGADGLIARIVWFDACDLASALDELEDRYLTQLASDEALAWQPTRHFIDSYNARDGLRATLADDCVIIDERVTGWGTLGPDSFVNYLQQLVGMAADAFLMCVGVHSVAAHGSVGRFQVSGTVPGGGEFEMLFETVGIVRDGKLVRLELLPEGQVEEALRRLGRPPP